MPLAFGNHVLDVARRELRRDASPIDLERQVFDLLLYLIRHRDRVVSKDDLLQAVWGGRIVSESALAARIHAARRALGDDGQTQRWVRTLRGAGYRFVGDVTETTPTRDAVEPVKAAFPNATAAGPSIAVAGFANLADDRVLDGVAAGLTETLVINLARLRWLSVLASGTALTFFDRGGGPDIWRSAVAMGARYLLAGAVRRAGDRMRITARLHALETGRQLWAGCFDRAVGGGFAVEDTVTDAILAAVELEVTEAEAERAQRTRREDLGTWELFQRARQHMLRRTRDDFVRARRALDEALALDPAFAPAYAAMAVYNFWQITHGFTADAEKSRAEGLDAALKAVNLAPRDALTRSALGLACMECGERDHAIAEHELASRLNPTSAFGQWSFGWVVNRTDRHDQALARFDRALALDPQGPMTWTYNTLRASALYHLRRYEEAALAGRVAMQTPLADVVWPIVHRAAALGRLGRKREAEPVIADLVRRRPGLTVTRFVAWPHHSTRSGAAVEHMAAGLHQAGLPM